MSSHPDVDSGAYARPLSGETPGQVSGATSPSHSAQGGGPRDGAVKEAGEQDEKGQNVSFTSTETKTDKKDDFSSEKAAQSRLKVHDASLYTDLLDGSDWTDVLEKERARKRQEALTLHSNEEAAAKARREEQLSRSRADAIALADEHKRRRMADEEAADTELFKRKNDAFLRHQADLLAMWGPMQESTRAHQQRVREQIYAKWEQEVFLPTQREITAKVTRKCASDTRSRLHTVNACQLLQQPRHQPYGGDGDNAGFAGWSGSGSGLEGDNGSSGLAISNPLHNNTGPRADLTWKERKDQMWLSFLVQCNLKSRPGGRGGLFLDVLDEVEYNPMQQCRDGTIYYKRRALPGSEVDQQRREAAELEKAYTLLGLAYRNEERKSRTGVLTEGNNNAGMPAVVTCAPTSPTTRCGTAEPNSADRGARGLFLHGRDAKGEEQLLLEEEERKRRTMPPPPAYVLPGGAAVASSSSPHAAAAAAALVIPCTRVPYDFSKTAMAIPGGRPGSNAQRQLHHSHKAGGGHGGRLHRSTSNSSTQRNDGMSGVTRDTNNAMHFSGSSSRHHLHSPRRDTVDTEGTTASTKHSSITVDHRALRTIQKQWDAARSAHDESMSPHQHHSGIDANTLTSMHRSYTNNNSCHNNNCNSTLGPQSLAATHKTAEVVLECEREVMPLPLNATTTSGPESGNRYLPWMQAPRGDRVLPREHYLPVQEWSKEKLASTVYGRYITPDGELMPWSERKKDEGYRLHESTVRVDHCDYPTGMQPQHYGKRMEMWRQC